uniref:Uncharacterized protein n=1 Tax=Rhizophora mucronata TaxID=61149 RepID=A0A2P2N544_RHIMU
MPIPRESHHTRPSPLAKTFGFSGALKMEGISPYLINPNPQGPCGQPSLDMLLSPQLWLRQRWKKAGDLLS